MAVNILTKRCDGTPARALFCGELFSHKDGIRAERYGKSTILMVFTRKDGDFHGRFVSFREGNWGYFHPYFSGVITYPTYNWCLLTHVASKFHVLGPM